MAFSPQDFTNGNVLNDSDLDQTDDNIDQVRNSHKGSVSPPSLVAGVRWIDDSTSIWTDKLYDGGGFLSEARIDPTSDLIMPVELRRRNLIVNGDLDVWQDGTSTTGLTASSNEVADGWRWELVTHGTWTIDRTTDVPTVAQAGRLINYSIRALVTTIDATVAAGAHAGLRYTIEGYDYNELVEQPHHISFWAKSNLTGTYHCALRNSGNDRSFVFTFSISVADTWELKEFVLRSAVSGGTWDRTNGVGLKLNITLVAGTDFHTTANAWQTGNFTATSAQANLAATVNNYMRIADLRLHGGTVRSPVIIPCFSEKLAFAQRRFNKTFDTGVKPAQNTGDRNGVLSTFATSTTFIGTVAWTYKQEMRSTPTVTTYNPDAANANWRNFGNTTDATASVANQGTSATRVDIDATVEMQAVIHASADARFT